MSDPETSAPVETPVPASCEVIKAELNKCVKEKGEAACKELMEAFAACIKNSSKAS